MHVEKNLFDSVIETFLNIQGKTKDGLNTRQDLVELGIRSQLLMRILKLAKYRLKAQVEKDEGPSGEG